LNEKWIKNHYPSLYYDMTQYKEPPVLCILGMVIVKGYGCLVIPTDLAELAHGIDDLMLDEEEAGELIMTPNPECQCPNCNPDKYELPDPENDEAWAEIMDFLKGDLEDE
jgi:hypothetical protein